MKSFKTLLAAGLMLLTPLAAKAEIAVRDSSITKVAEDTITMAKTKRAKKEIAKEENSETPQPPVITPPEYRGGMKAFYEYVSNNFIFPEEAVKRSINGVAEVEFTVEKSGDVTYVGIMTGIDESVDEEILRLLQNMPRWIPATRNGEPARYRVSMPLTLKVSRARTTQRSELSLPD